MARKIDGKTSTADVSRLSIERNVADTALHALDKPVPDGGLQAWLQCAASFLLLFNSFGIVNSYGAFQTFYKTQLLSSHSNSEIAWIGSIQSFLNIFLGFVVGPIYDRGHVRPLVFVGGTMTISGLIFTGLCTQYWELLLAQGVLLGSGVGFLFLPSIAILSQHFEKRLSFATGLGSSGAAIGSICLPVLFDRLQPRIGFRNATWAIALIALITIALALMILRMRYRPSTVRHFLDVQAWTEAPFNLWSAYLFVTLLALYLPSFYIQEYAATVMEARLAFYTLPVLNLGSLFGRLIPPYIADKIGPLNVEIPLTACVSVLAFAWIGIVDKNGTFVFSAIYGFFAGAITTVTAPIDITMSPSLDRVGTRLGMLLFPWSLGVLVGTPIGGAFIASDNGWLFFKLFIGSVLFAGAIICWLTKISKYGHGWKKF